MPLFFWDFNDFNDSERQWLCFILNLIVFIFAVIALYRSWKFHRKIRLEALPLTFNLLSTLVLVLLKLFEKGYEFDLIGYLIEIFTYFLFAFTFGVILLKMKGQNKNTNKTKLYIISFVLAILTLIVLVLLVSIKVIERSCERNLVVISIITLSCELASYIPAVYNGKEIVKLLNKQKKSSMTETMLSGTIQIKPSLSDQFTIERKKQIIIVLGFYTLSLIIRFVLLIVSLVTQDSDFIECQDLQGIVIITSDSFFGQFILILIEINQLLPHVIIPLAIFIVPMKTQRKKHNLMINVENSSSYNEQDEDTLESRSQIIQSRVHSVFSQKNSSPRKR